VRCFNNIFEVKYAAPGFRCIGNGTQPRVCAHPILMMVGFHESVIASEAKQSIIVKEMDCFVASLGKYLKSAEA
jgi:hypothetical protein